MTIKQKVNARLPMTGTHVNLSDPIVTEILSSIGYDFVWVDMEHTSLSCEQVHTHLLAAASGGTPVIVRVPVDDLTFTKRILEMGPAAVVFPMVKDAEHAKHLLDNTLYPPYGTRGCGPKGAIRYGIDDEPAYYKEGHLEMCRFVQIERKSAALDAEAIAAIPYLDGCVLGMYDLSGSIGRPGEIFCDENMALATHAIEEFHKVGKPVGVSTFATDDATLERYHKMGVDIIFTGADYDYILRGARETLARMQEIRKG